MWCFVSLFLVVSTSAIDCLERLVSEMTCYVSTLYPTHSLTFLKAFTSQSGRLRSRLKRYRSSVQHSESLWSNCPVVFWNKICFISFVSVLSIFAVILLDWSVYVCYCSKQLALAVNWWFHRMFNADHRRWVSTAAHRLWPLSHWTGWKCSLNNYTAGAVSTWVVMGAIVRY